MFDKKKIESTLFDIGYLIDQLIDNTTGLMPELDKLDDANQAVFDKNRAKK